MTELPTGIVTFLFTDIEGSTKLLQELGEDYGEVQDLHQKIMREAIQAEGGAEIRTEGDSFFVVFPSPAQALRAAVTAQRSLAAATWPHGQALKVRMGMHTGEGRIRGGDYLGIDVNRAARIAAAAHGGQVVISDATRGLVQGALPDGVALRDLGQHRLKDLVNPERLFDLAIDELASDFPALKSLEARPNNLPTSLSSFIGREDDVELAVALLRGHRLVTLTGPGGTGKTRLSLEIARTLLPEFPDGTFFVDLSPIGSPTLVPSVVGQVLGVSEQGDRAPVETLRDHLRDLQLLLVLDNFEQIVEAASVVEELLQAAPKLRVLVTSRVPLHVYGEEEFAVRALEMPDPQRLPSVEQLSQYEAVALFIDRARAVRGDFSVTNENAPAVAEICVRLDGLPLAIELAAVRVKVLSPDEILARLGHRLPLLTGGAQNRPERQRTLRNAIAWSHDLLDDHERQLFARFAAFSGGATFEAIEAVCNPGAEIGIDTLDGVGSLVDKSLVRPTEVADGGARFGMLETIREFATERLAETEDPEIRRRHAEFFRAFAEEAEPRLQAEDQAFWLDRCEQEQDNIRAALRWSIDAGDVETALRIGGSLWRFWYPRGQLLEGSAWLDEALSLPGPRDRHRAKARAAAGGLAYWRTDYDATGVHYEEALAISRELGDRRGEMDGLYNLGFVPMLNDDWIRAGELWEESLAIARELGDEGLVARGIANMGFVRMMSGAPAEAIPLFEDALAEWKRMGNQTELGDITMVLGQAYQMLGDLPQAAHHYRNALRIVAEIRNLALVAGTLDALAGVASGQGRHERAARLKGASQGIRDVVGGSVPLSTTLAHDAIQVARSEIGDEAVEQAIEAGKSMDLVQAVAYAVDEGQE
jgi:predicted ATPase/class 3 adenylate cyclase